ncbi:MAG: OsmC family protein [Saprospiraceae bacterium]
MITSTVEYNGDLRATATHVRSGESIFTDAPIDNHGKGMAFSPTDLLATSLASCALTTIAILGKSKNINIDGAKADVVKHMASDPRRVTKVEIIFQMPTNKSYTPEEKDFIIRTIDNCPVAKSLHPDLIQAVEVKW